METLRDTVAVITGGASGIGLALARRFATEGAKLVLADIEPGALASAERDLASTGAEVIGVRTDVADAQSVERLLSATLEHFGKVNVLCNNAGVQRSAQAWKLSAAEWKWLLDVNLMGVVHGVRTFVPRMLEQGDPCHVVNTASLGGLVAAPLMSAYCVTKFGVVALSESLRLELSGTQVGVSVVCPAFVKTSLGSAERNMPESVNQGLSEEELTFRNQVGQGAAALIDGGIDPSEVAERVLVGIHADALYVLTHAEAVKAFKRRADKILAAGAPLVGDPTDGS
jgi:NADP-dependent 3-hydroxy acid dehydrogenase YdfG